MDPTLLPAGWKYRCVQQSYVYISLPSESPTCNDLDLPSLPTGWSYHCAPASRLTNADGTGWFPGRLLGLDIKSLPVDPINNATVLNYYAYAAEEGSSTPSFFVAATLDSNKYLMSYARTSKSLDPLRYENGSNVSLLPKLNGLLSFISFNASNLDSVTDSINPIWDITLDKRATLVLDNVESYVANFSTNSSIDFSSTVFNKPQAVSVVARIKPTYFPQNAGIIAKGNSGYSAYNFGISVQGNNFSFAVKNTGGEQEVASAG